MEIELIIKMAVETPPLSEAKLKDTLNFLKLEGANQLGLICFVYKNQQISLNEAMLYYEKLIL